MPEIRLRRTGTPLTPSAPALDWALVDTDAPVYASVILNAYQHLSEAGAAGYAGINVILDASDASTAASDPRVTAAWQAVVADLGDLMGHYEWSDWERYN